MWGAACIVRGASGFEIVDPLPWEYTGCWVPLWKPVFIWGVAAVTASAESPLGLSKRLFVLGVKTILLPQFCLLLY